MRNFIDRFYRKLAISAVLILACQLAAPVASAATLTRVMSFGNNPSNLEMHLYVPDQLASPPPVLVAVHYCTGSAQAFFSGTQFASLADQYGYIVIYPSATRSGQCFDVYTQQALTRGGGSDPVSIKSMVDYVLQNHNADANRIYVTGVSSGAMMTNVLLALYPDVFKAGAAFAGVPYTCFATTGGSTWNSDCSSGNITKTAQEWGNIVRNAFPGFTGARPRVQLWHGTNDTLVPYSLLQESIEQWTNVFGLSQTPTSTDTPRPNWNRRRYADKVEAYSIQGAGHSLPSAGMAAVALQFFGITG